MTDDVLSEFVNALGWLLEQWWQKCEYRGERFEEDEWKKVEHLTEKYWEVSPADGGDKEDEVNPIGCEGGRAAK